MRRRIAIGVGALFATVLVALVFAPQRSRRITARPGPVRLVPVYSDGTPVPMALVNFGSAPRMISDGWAEPFTPGTHRVELLVIESHGHSAKYPIELQVEGAPASDVQEINVPVWRLTAGGLWHAARRSWRDARIIGTTRRVVVHLRAPDGVAVADAHVFCDADMVRSDPRGDADCGLRKGELTVTVLESVTPQTRVADGVSDVPFVFTRVDPQ